MIRTLSSLVLFFLLLYTGTAAGKISFQSFELIPQGGYLSYHIEDLNTDGYKDIVLLTTPDKKGKEIKNLDIYFQTERGFTGQPDIRLPLPENLPTLTMDLWTSRNLPSRSMLPSH